MHPDRRPPAESNHSSRNLPRINPLGLMTWTRFAFGLEDAMLLFMANFLTRIELHDADSDDYTTLHAAMEAKGFRRTIIGGDQPCVARCLTARL